MQLRDAPARERAVRDTAATLFVEAGAGAGKTTALVDRIVQLIARGARIEQVAAITFTEKAAAELTDRVRQRLEEAAEGKGPPDTQGERERARCREAAAGLDGASFQTIHAFARKILASYPVQAGLPPEFDVLDETEEEIELREQLRRFLDLLETNGETREPLALAYALGLRPRHVQGLARAFSQEWHRLRGEEFQAPAREPDWEPRLLTLLDGIDPGSATEKLQQHLEGLRTFAGRLDAAYRRFRDAVPAEREARLVEMLTLAARAPAIQGHLGKGRPLAPVKVEFEAWLGDIRAWALGQLLPAVQRFALDYAAERRRAGRVTFHDLLVLAVDLLREHPEVREALHRQVVHLLIDEFQDTDPLQVELAALIAGDPEEVCEWQRATVAQGRLFFVGDPKQSIYRFRRADIRIYLAAKTAFGAQQEQLTTNFRSTQRVVAWVNAVGSRLFGGDEQGGYQAPWVPLDAHDGAPEGVPVRVFGGAVEGSAAEARELEARDVARAVLQARAENWAGAAGGTRFGDIAILLRRRTGLVALERALADRGIPYRVESRSLLFASEEARDLATVLLAIDDPTDRIALVAALRSPLFACTDAELAAHVRAGGRWTYEEEAPAGSPARVREALTQLATWHRERWTTTPAGLMERVVRECNLLLVGLGELRPREAWRRYRLLAEQARALTVRGAVATLRQFVDWLERQREEGVRLNEASVPEPDDDAVRIMTVHAAKGLEFPVVFVTGLGGGGRWGEGVDVWWPGERGGGLPEVRCGGKEHGFATPGAAGRDEEEQHHEEAEEVRLFYVAATRAARALAVSLYRAKRGDSKSVASRVEAALEEAPPASWERFAPSALAVAPAGAGMLAAGAAPVPQRDDWRRRREELVARWAKAPVVAGTAVAHAAAPEAPEEAEEIPATAGEPWRKGRAGTSIGRAVHAVLQSIDLVTGEGLEAAAVAQAEAEGVGDRADEVARLARAALASEAVRAAAAGGRFWREVYVGAELEGGVVIEGFLDLLAEGPDGLVIIDYKTDSLRGEAEVDVAMVRYRLQGAAYALAAERAVGKPVRRVVFVFTEPRIDREVEDLEAAKAEAQRLALGLAGSASG